ncbi:MAG: 50S ribosomal protein L20 [Dehalococcoidia bacterium]|nr:50S ribosomal protein L20 [Dehalococcoidia bacterium]
MTRVKRGVTKHQRHKKIMSLARGYQTASGHSFRRAREALLHAWSHAYRHRRERKREFRRLWILRINAASRNLGISYNQLIRGLSKANIAVDRKMLSETAIHDPKGFEDLVEIAKNQLGTPIAP